MAIEEDLDAFQDAVVEIVSSGGGDVLGSALGIRLRQCFNFTKLLGPLQQIEASGCGIRIVYPAIAGGDIRVVLSDKSVEARAPARPGPYRFVAAPAPAVGPRGYVSSYTSQHWRGAGFAAPSAAAADAAGARAL